MDTKFIILSAVLILINLSEVYGNERMRRNANRGLQTSLMDNIQGDIVKSKIWKRAVPRELEKTTKYNEAIPLMDINLPINSGELPESDTGPLTTETKNSRNFPPSSNKKLPNTIRPNSSVKSPQNTKLRDNPRTTSKPKPKLPDPNSLLSSEDIENPDLDKTPDLNSDSVKTSSTKSKKPQNTPNKSRNLNDEPNDGLNADEDEEEEEEDEEEDEEDAEQPTEDENENTEDENEPGENAEDEKHPDDNIEDEVEPDENTENEEESEDDANDEKDPSEEVDHKEAKVEREKPTGAKAPTSTKRPSKPIPVPKPTRAPSAGHAKPPPPFPDDLSPTSVKKSQSESPITYIRPFKFPTTTQPTSTEDPEFSDEEPTNSNDNIDENPTLSPIPLPRPKTETKNHAKAPTGPQVNRPSTKTTKKPNKIPPQNSCPDNIDETEPNDSELEEPLDDLDEYANPNPTTTTIKPQNGVKTRQRNPSNHHSRQHPNESKHIPSHTIEDEDPDIHSESDERRDLASKFADTDSDTQLPINPDDNTPMSRSKPPNRQQYPRFNPTPEEMFKNNPFFSSPFGFGPVNSFSSTGTNANGGVSASSSTSSSSNAGAPAWEPWPSLFKNRFPNTPMNPPPMFSNNPFLNGLINPNEQQIKRAPFIPNRFNNDINSSQNRPIRGDPSSSAPLKPKGYTPIISISGSFDTNGPSISSRSSFPPSDLTSHSTNAHSFDSHVNMNAPSHGPMWNTNIQPFFDQMSDSGSHANHGQMSRAGDFVSVSSFSKDATGGTSSSSSSTSLNGRPYPRNNVVGGFPAGSRAGWFGNPFGGQNWGLNPLNTVSSPFDILNNDGNGATAFAFGSASSGINGLHHAGFTSLSDSDIQSQFAQSKPLSGVNTQSSFSSVSSSTKIGADGKPHTEQAIASEVSKNGKSAGLYGVSKDGKATIIHTR